MTTELVLLLGLFAFITGGVFFGPKGPRAVFNKSGPRLAARIEHHLQTGRTFKTNRGAEVGYRMPDGAAPDGTMGK